MKRTWKLHMTAGILVATSSACLAKPSIVKSTTVKSTTLRVAFRAVDKANQGRHIGAKPLGGLILGSKVLRHRETFTLIDLNGGALQDGDVVRIATGGDRPTYWQESKGKVNRIGGRPGAACQFKIKWKQKNKTLSLRAPSGKFVSGPGKAEDMVTVASASDPTIVFELLKNPKPAPKPTAPKGGASKSAGPKRPAAKPPAASKSSR